MKAFQKGLRNLSNQHKLFNIPHSQFSVQSAFLHRLEKIKHDIALGGGQKRVDKQH